MNSKPLVDPKDPIAAKPWLRQRRELHNMTQVELAKASGVNAAKLSCYEKYAPEKMAQDEAVALHRVLDPEPSEEVKNARPRYRPSHAEVTPRIRGSSGIRPPSARYDVEIELSPLTETELLLVLLMRHKSGLSLERHVDNLLKTARKQCDGVEAVTPA